MSDQNRPASPDQNDPTGHTRAGSPTYREGNWPANSHQPLEHRSPLPKNAREARERNAVGTLEQPAEEEPNVPPPAPPTNHGAPD